MNSSQVKNRKSKNKAKLMFNSNRPEIKICKGDKQVVPEFDEDSFGIRYRQVSNKMETARNKENSEDNSIQNFQNKKSVSNIEDNSKVKTSKPTLTISPQQRNSARHKFKNKGSKGKS